MLERCFFDSLIGEILLVRQVYFLARRLVPFTKAGWPYDCLAQFEKYEVKGAEVLRSITYDVLADVTIDLLPIKFDRLPGCRVGVLSRPVKSLYHVAIELFDQVVAFKRYLNQLVNPCLVARVQLEGCPNFADRCGIAFGGS